MIGSARAFFEDCMAMRAKAVLDEDVVDAAKPDHAEQSTKRPGWAFRGQESVVAGIA